MSDIKKFLMPKRIATLIVSSSVLLLATLFWGCMITILFPAAFNEKLRRWVFPYAQWCLYRYAGCCRFANYCVGTETDFKVLGDHKLHLDHYYLLLSNHQSWFDILLQLMVFHQKIPPLKFFPKKELKYVPVIGWVSTILGFPFMQRSKSPGLRKHDLEQTRKACERFCNQPSTMLLYVEGTRNTAEKHSQQQSRYLNLLNPKAGGMFYTLQAMPSIHEILLVLLVYPDNQVGMPEYLAGMIKKIKVWVDVLPADEWRQWDYLGNKQHREQFQVQLNQLWERADMLITKARQESSTT